MTIPELEFDESELSRRLRVAREHAGITQADAAAKLEVARTTLVAIEQGKRTLRLNELQKLAKAYGTSVNALLKRERMDVSLLPKFRTIVDPKDLALSEAATLLQVLVTAELELESALGIIRRKDYPPERPLLPGDVREQAEHDASQLRRWLGIGEGPLLDVFPVLELQLGLRIYQRPLHSSVSGLFAFDSEAGGCVLINSNHPIGRRHFSLCHECGHFIATRRAPEVLRQEVAEQSREERYADSFARSFLMPSASVKQHFADLTAGQTHFTRRHVIHLARMFGVSREAVVRRLEQLKVIRTGTWDWFQQNGGITDDQQVAAELGEPTEGATASAPLPERLALLAREVWKRELYSEGQLSRLLRVGRAQIREVLDGADLESDEEDVRTSIPR